MGIPTYLYISNDKWFDIDQIIKDHNGVVQWWKKPKRIAKGDRVYMYLSGGSKCVKYEFLVTKNDLVLGDTKMDFKKYIKDPKFLNHDKGAPTSTPMIEMKLVREIKDTHLTSPRLMKENGNILGTLMSNRQLRPPSIIWLDSIK